MKLYRIWQEVNNGYDTYDSAVVAAESADEARNIHPQGGSGLDSSTWCKPKDVKVKCIGEASAGFEKGVVVASFNAG